MKRDNCHDAEIRRRKKEENNFYVGARLSIFGNVSSRDEVGKITKLMLNEKILKSLSRKVFMPKSKTLVWLLRRLMYKKNWGIIITTFIS